MSLKNMKNLNGAKLLLKDTFTQESRLIKQYFLANAKKKHISFTVNAWLLSEIGSIQCTSSFYFILSSEINVYQKWIKVIFSLQN